MTNEVLPADLKTYVDMLLEVLVEEVRHLNKEKIIEAFVLRRYRNVTAEKQIEQAKKAEEMVESMLRTLASIERSRSIVLHASDILYHSSAGSLEEVLQDVLSRDLYE